MNLSRRKLIKLSLALPVMGGITGPAFAATPKWYATDGVAINGYDPVAYFNAKAPISGTAAQASDYDGVTWYFSSAENKAAFIANPDGFAPQFGGYCAYAVSKGATATTQPDAWTVWNDRLYLNFNTTVRGIWRQDIPGNVAKAEANWPGVLA